MRRARMVSTGDNGFYWFGPPRSNILRPVCCVDGKNLFNVSIGLASVQVTYTLLHLWEIPRFVNPRSNGIASA
jgi:hypothetical protein